jgi:hypothetical protein
LFGSLDVARDGDEWAGVAGTASCDGHLSAFDVELGDAGWVGVVDCELFNSEEVVTVGDAGGDGSSVCF